MTLREGYAIEDALSEARTMEAELLKAGMDQAGLEEAVRQGLANGAFEESEGDGTALVEELFGEGAETPTHPEEKKPGQKVGLGEKLQVRVDAQERRGGKAR